MSPEDGSKLDSRLSSFKEKCMAVSFCSLYGEEVAFGGSQLSPQFLSIVNWLEANGKDQHGGYVRRVFESRGFVVSFVFSLESMIKSLYFAQGIFLLPRKRILCQELDSKMKIFNWDSDARAEVVPHVISIISPTTPIYDLEVPYGTPTQIPVWVIGWIIHLAVPAERGIVGLTLPLDPACADPPTACLISRTDPTKVVNAYPMIYGYRSSVGTERRYRERRFIEIRHSWAGEVTDTVRFAPLSGMTRESMMLDWVDGDEFSNTPISFDSKKAQMYLHKIVY